jgi:hypothetical protein
MEPLKLGNFAFHSNKFPSVNMFHEDQFCSRSQMSEQALVSVHRVYSVSL